MNASLKCFKSKRTILLLVTITGFLGKAEAQKGEKSVAAGVFYTMLANKNVIYQDGNQWNNGIGLEAIGQYNSTRKSAAIVQIRLTHFYGYSYTSTIPDIHSHTSINSLSLQAGYRYQFTTSGFYTNVLAGVEFYDLSDNFSAALEVGKRFTIKDLFFFDTGIDFTNGFLNRYNIKAVFSLVRRPKAN